MSLVASRPPSFEQPTLLRPTEQSVSFVELGPPSDAVEPFKQLVMDSQVSNLRLYCTLPTWSPSSDHCLDLHDLHQLRSKFLVLVHDLVQALRSSGIAASYVLVPSSCSRCIVCAGGCSDLASAVDLLQKTPLESSQQHKVLLADVGCPCLILT